MVSKVYNETHGPKGQENKIYTIVKGRETLYRRHKVSRTSCSEVKYVLKKSKPDQDSYLQISHSYTYTVDNIIFRTI